MMSSTVLNHVLDGQKILLDAKDGTLLVLDFPAHVACGWQPRGSFCVAACQPSGQVLMFCARLPAHLACGRQQ